MQVHIAFRDAEPTPRQQELVRRKAEWLRKYFPDVLTCRVMVETPHRHRREGRLHHVRVELDLPGAQIVVGRHPSLRAAHRDLEVAIRDAFHAARRLLMDHARKVRRQVKVHVVPGAGRVTRLLRGGYGFLETQDGREIYFHRNSVLDGFDRLRVGTRVRFHEESGEEGPQASTITLAGRRVRSRAGARP
jgi:cold shock CspA family protein/ribosome-associated translation inhibitor RaiA